MSIYNELIICERNSSSIYLDLLVHSLKMYTWFGHYPNLFSNCVLCHIFLYKSTVGAFLMQLPNFIYFAWADPEWGEAIKVF